MRRAVVEHLAEFKRDEKAGQAVADRLQAGDSSPLVEAEAAKALGVLKVAGAFETILAALERTSWNEVVRSRALDGLGALEDPRALPILIDWSQYGRPAQTRTAATAALGKLGKAEQQRPQVVERLTELLDDPALRVRIAAARALGTLGDKDALPALQRLADRDAHGFAVRRAREAVRQIREGLAQSDEVASLRTDLDKLTTENRELRDRIDALEKAHTERMATASS